MAELKATFTAVHHIPECWENLGLFLGVLIGPAWYPVFKQCGAILLEIGNSTGLGFDQTGIGIALKRMALALAHMEKIIHWY